MPARLAGALWLALTAPGLAQQAPIDSFALRGHTYFLAHDLLEGRGTGGRGADVAALYLATAAERLGLRPAGEAGSYFQRVPLVEATIDTARTALRLTGGGGATGRTVRYATPEAFLYNVGTTRTLVPFAGGTVYVGTAAEVVARAEVLPPLEGHVAVMHGLFGADAAAADTLRARGATGVVHVLGSPELYRLYVQSRGASRMFIAPEVNAASSFIPDIPSVIVHPSLEVQLLERAPGDGVVAIPSRRIEVSIGTTARAVPARNVAALLPGRDSTVGAELVAYTAHYDHLGFSAGDEHGDSLYNGFSDNAAGAAMLLAIAQTFTAAPPARSVLFLWFTGEERGLLGSDYFVARPTVPSERIAAVINLDAGAPPARSVTWRIAGGTQSTLGALAVDVARAAGWDATLSPPSPNSDYFPFLRIGVPAVFLVPGAGAFEGLTGEQSQALRQRWDRYHQAGDHWSGDFPFAGLVRYAEFAQRLGRAAAEQPRPRLYGAGQP